MLKNRIKHFVGRFPSLFFPFYKVFGPRKNQKLLFDSNTELVIEGFPRSANTFAVVAFEQAQLTPVNLAHHLHVESQLTIAAKHGVPAVALLRNPEDSFRSLLIRHPDTPVSWIIQRYIHFYTAVKNAEPNCLVVEYEDIISDMGKVVDKINKHFDKNFTVPVHDEKMTKRVFEQIESFNKKVNQGRESHVARPSDERKKQAKEIDFTGHEKNIRLATALYESLKSSQ